MRLSNRNKAGYFHFLSTLITVGLFLGIFLFFLERYRYHYLGWSEFLLIIIPILGILIFYLRGRQIFEYDSDGEAVNFKNRNIIPFLTKEAKDEFPKYKLISYEVVNAILFKKLFIKIKSKKDHAAIILKYDISYLTIKEIKDLKVSLSKIVKANREAKREGKTQGQ